MKKHTGSKETFYVCAHARSIENVLSGISLEQEKKSCFTLPFFDLLKKHWCMCLSMRFSMLLHASIARWLVRVVA